MFVRCSLALWSRRLLGEASTQAQYVMAEHDELVDLVVRSVGAVPGVGEVSAAGVGVPPSV